MLQSKVVIDQRRRADGPANQTKELYELAERTWKEFTIEVLECNLPEKKEGHHSCATISGKSTRLNEDGRTQDLEWPHHMM